jgi:hypothetical protein
MTSSGRITEADKFQADKWMTPFKTTLFKCIPHSLQGFEYTKLTVMGLILPSNISTTIEQILIQDTLHTSIN